MKEPGKKTTEGREIRCIDCYRRRLALEAENDTVVEEDPINSETKPAAGKRAHGEIGMGLDSVSEPTTAAKKEKGESDEANSKIVKEGTTNEDNNGAGAGTHTNLQSIRK